MKYMVMKTIYILRKRYFMNSEEVKELFFSLDADLCGIASIDRFEDAPSGYHPLDVLPSCKSVISFACRFPVGTLACKTDVPFSKYC